MPDEADAPHPGRWRSGATFRVFLDDMNEFWQTSEGRRLQGAQQADEADLQAWLADQSGVVVHDHGGYAPEQWKGEVDGHSFYFRERDTEWDIEIDLHPSGHSMRVVDGTHDDGTTRYRQHQIIEGDVIATGTIAAESYGTNPRERAEFIVTTVREHLRRKRVAEIARTVAERSAELNHRLS
ncbi:hypothetical protein [Mycolicibacterium fluoranthenivorans]|uniref:Uncharacterized protein n=1 Tax=Mycolicibacterium fluoranthenivorans TaxID=258505 RepID=A0A7X5ZFQ1_9MYCO|nr:hypothetical protein [Mycolicibacterium fluoranthenivorans]MCV7355396.1 hypothetical protein [Mycolicibacterium fluoranthenivorans]NIH98337.1 hypothetical protein [Mycolicibacterium fluoranthenivorans]